MLRENEIWNMVPPEEKLELLAKSHVSGIYTSVILCAVCFTLAIAFKAQWLVWGSLCLSPLVFQSGAAKAWRGLKPKVLLEYLAARSVARRFAYAANAQALDVELLFRGKVMELREGETPDLSEAIDSIEKNNREAIAWIGLLRDSIVAFKEGPGGGTLQFVSITDRRLEVSGKNSDNSKAEYSSKREVFIKFTKGFGKSASYRITSEYPVALNAFEKKLAIRLEAKRKAAAEAEAPRQVQSESSDEIGSLYDT
jgi:hypothetical protein